MKKRIAFVDRGLDTSHDTEKVRYENNKRIIIRLSELYEVDLHFDIDKSGTWKGIVEDSKKQGPYHAVITHVRPRMPGPCSLEIARRGEPMSIEESDYILYKYSLENIKALHEKLPEAKIIAYTAAPRLSLTDKRLGEYGVSHVWRRKEHTAEGLERDIDQLIGWLDTEEMSHLENITEEQLSQALKNINDLGFLQKSVWRAGRVGTLTGMIREYAPKLGKYMEKQELTTMDQVMTSYFNTLYPEFQKKFWKAVSVSVFAGQIVEVVAELFPHLKDEIRQWENAQGNDFIWRYSEWNKEEREWHPR